MPYSNNTLARVGVIGRVVVVILYEVYVSGFGYLDVMGTFLEAM
jgi:hypothetical protein